MFMVRHAPCWNSIAQVELKDDWNAVFPAADR
jgi:hypothetical protein